MFEAAHRRLTSIFLWRLKKSPGCKVTERPAGSARRPSEVSGRELFQLFPSVSIFWLNVGVLNRLVMEMNRKHEMLSRHAREAEANYGMLLVRQRLAQRGAPQLGSHPGISFCHICEGREALKSVCVLNLRFVCCGSALVSRPSSSLPSRLFSVVTGVTEAPG